MSADLGILEPASECLLESRFFPSKIGGHPAWLDLESVPKYEEIVCSICHLPRHFLCQLYCPIDEKEYTFHRTIFTFVCLTKGCFLPNNNRNFIVFRCQLPRKNKFYSYNPPVESEKWKVEDVCKKFDVSLCDICGIQSEITSVIYKKNFCSDVHQNIYTAKLEVNSKTNFPASLPNLCLPEFGLRIEPDEQSDYSESDSGSNSDSSECSAERRFDDYKTFLVSDRVGPLQNDPSLESYVNGLIDGQKDDYITKFKTHTSRHPKQVIRYAKGMQSLWLTEEYIPTPADIPLCQYCGSERQFEFQILPQLLISLNLDSNGDIEPGILDWGTLAVYTCKESCNIGPSYKTEFLWKQDVV